MGKYDNLSKEELIRKYEALENQNLKLVEMQAKENKMNRWNKISIRKIVADLLKILMNSDNEHRMDNALTVLLEFFNVDRVYIANYNESINKLGVTNEVTKDRLFSLVEELGDLSEEEFPWWFEQMKNGKDIILSNIDDLPPEAIREKNFLEKQEIVSLLVLMTFSNGKPIGFIGLDAVHTQRNWTSLEYENLRTFADIMSIVLEGRLSYNKMLRSDAKFKMIFDRLPVGVEVYDADGYLTDLNNADERAFKVERKNVLGVNLFENPNLPQDQMAKLRQGIDVDLKFEYIFDNIIKGKYYNTELGGERRYLSIKCTALKGENDIIFGFIIIVNDQTEDVLLQNKIVSLNNIMDTILNNVPVVIMVKDIQENFKILYYNKASEKFSGKSSEEVIGKNNSALFDDPVRAAEIQELDERAVRENGYNEYAKEYVTATGRKRVVNVCRIPIDHQRENGNPMLIVMIWDITEQQQNEVDLIKAREADKLKSAFLANMSHEIRTPLNAIVGFSGIIAETENESERQSYMKIINKNSALLLQLINDILDFSKIESGKFDFNMQYVDIKDICKEAYNVHSLKITSQLRFLFDETHLPSVMINTDPRRVMQILSNFLTNAIKFTHEGSITIHYEVKQNEVIISVTDTGMGISETDTPTIFERFVKLNEFKQGTGLGLAISKMIVERMNGKIGLHSVLGKGSTFWFSLPLQEEVKTYNALESIQLPKVSEKVEKPAPKLHTILIAEDVEENYYLLKVLLGKKYELYHAWNGKEAVEMYKEYNPELVLMDIKMPIMDGFEATKLIREISSDVPVVALTAFAFENEKNMAKEYRFTDYIVKPLDLVLVKKIIAQYLRDTE